MPVTGVHAILYSPQAEALRALLGDTFGWPQVDAGGGWLIFGLPPAELGVHPADHPSHELSLICDDLDATVAELRGKGVEIPEPPQHRAFGRTTTLVLPGGVEVLLYEPRHPRP